MDNFKNKINQPFYEPPPRKTSAEIINEARLAIRESQMGENSFIANSIKPLQTHRPFTPRNKERLLFGKNKNKSNRPPSSFSLRYLQNETDTAPQFPPPPPPSSSSSTTNNNKTKPGLIRKERSNSLTELQANSKIFNIGIQELPQKIKLPSIDPIKTIQQKRRLLFKNSATSLDNLPEEREPAEFEPRKAFSSPQERTDFSPTDNNNNNSPFGYPSTKQQNLSKCLLLGPQNLNKIFDNKLIIENSQTLFTKTGYFNQEFGRNTNVVNKSILANNKNNDIIDKKTNRNTDDILNDLNRINYNVNDNLKIEENIIKLLEELYELMEKENLLTMKINSKMKIFILKTLYKFVESQNEHLLLNIARIILGLKVTGNNLNGVCKLIFKVAKNEKNDNLFFQKNILELFLDALGRSSPFDDTEACIYGYGAIKFLTMNVKLLEKFLSLGILQLMILHIKLINNAKMDKTPQMSDNTNHALYQLTGALRNIVADNEIYENFINSGAIQQLCQSLELFITDLDIVSNISRVFSIISTNDCCCDILIEYKNIYKIFVQLFTRYPGNEEIIVRLAYTLGNIVAKIDNTRVKFYREKNSMESLIELWKIYLERTLKIYSLKSDNEDNNNSLIINNNKNNNNNNNPEDVMIKIIRIVANIVINPEIGKLVNDQYGNQLIDELIKVLISNPFKKNSELVLSILSTLNNLTYYYTININENHIFHVKQIEICDGIVEFLKIDNNELIIESMRILGNLSRSNITRSYIIETGIFQLLLNNLDNYDITLLKTTIGVFINLMSDNKSRQQFKQMNGVKNVVKILKEFSHQDWTLAMLICQAIWNYTIDTIDLNELIPDDEIQQLLIILADCLDEEKLFGITDTICQDNNDNDIFITQEYLVWEEFAVVATNLLEKIEYFLDTFDQIDINTKVVEANRNDCETNISFAAW